VGGGGGGGGYPHQKGIDDRSVREDSVAVAFKTVRSLLKKRGEEEKKKRGGDRRGVGVCGGGWWENNRPAARITLKSLGVNSEKPTTAQNSSPKLGRGQTDERDPLWMVHNAKKKGLSLKTPSRAGAIATEPP